jgi:hypothetical protein
MLATEVSSLRTLVGEKMSIVWTLMNCMDAQSVPLTLTITDGHPTDPELEDNWFYEGPCIVDFALEPGQSQQFKAWIIGLRPGQLALPMVAVTPTNPADAMPHITTIEHPPILVTL